MNNKTMNNVGGTWTSTLLLQVQFIRYTTIILVLIYLSHSGNSAQIFFLKFSLSVSVYTAGKAEAYRSSGL